jgi:hypothetical protein
MIRNLFAIRIPADNFDQLLNKISESAEKLDSKNINALDKMQNAIIKMQKKVF